MENDTDSEKLGVIIFGQKFCSKLEHIPIKKRILLRDSAVYKHTPPSVEELNQTSDSDPVSQNTNPPGTSFVGKHSDQNSFSEQQADCLKSLQLIDNCREAVAMKIEEADSHLVLSDIQTTVDVIVDYANKDPRAGGVSHGSKGELHSVSSFAPVDKRDSLIAKSSGAVLSLTGNVTEDSYSVDKSAIQPDDVSCKDLEAVQSITQDNRILWDLNVEMDAWEKPDNLLNVEYKSDLIASDVQSDSNMERSEDYKLKPETASSENDTENNVHPRVESMNSDVIYKHEQITSDSTDGERWGSVREDQEVAAGSYSKACSIVKPSMEIASMNLSCNREVASKTDEHVTLTLSKNPTYFSDCAPKRDPGSVGATPNSSFVSTEEQFCDNKNIIIKGEGSVNILHNGDNNLSMEGTDPKDGQNDVTLSPSANQLEPRASVKESDLFATREEKIIAETTIAAPSTRELIETPPNHVDIDVQKPLLGSFWEGCDASILRSVSVSDMCHQGATVVNQVPSMDKNCWAQTEQDYEDGELREMDLHCWNEHETKIGEIECLDYEPEIEDIDDLDESKTSASVCKGESGLKRKKCKLSETLVKDHLVRMDDVKMGLNGSKYGPHFVNTQLEKKISGWDQLPKDGRSSSVKVQETQGMLSRTLRSEPRSCSDIPTLSEEAEDKETVVERRIRPKDMDDSYHADCGPGYDKFNGRRRSTPHIHGRNQAEDWNSERRSSVNYHDIYDDHSGSRQMKINSKNREQCRSRSPYDRNETYGPHISYSRYSRGGNGSRAEGSGRNLSGARNGYMGSLADDRSESEFCMRPQFVRRDGSFSPRPAAHFSESFFRSRSRSRTRSPPLWVPPYEPLGPRVHRRSPDFSADDREKRTRLPFWKSNYPPGSEMRCNSPPRIGYLRQIKSRWNDEEDLDLRVSRDRSPVRSFVHKEKFDSSCSRRSFKSSEDFRSTGYGGRIRERTPDRVRGYIGGRDRRRHQDSFDSGQRKHYYKDSFARQNDAEDGIATQNYPLKDDFLEDEETRGVSMRKKESKSHEKYEYAQLSYPPSSKR